MTKTAGTRPRCRTRRHPREQAPRSPSSQRHAQHQKAARREMDESSLLPVEVEILSEEKRSQNLKKELAGMLLEREDGRERRSLQPYRGCLSQDDSLLGCSSGILPPFTQTLRRFGSCESGNISINSQMIEEWHLFSLFKDFVAVFLAYQIVLLLKRCLRWAKDIPPSAFLTSAKLKPIPNSADSFIQCAFLLEGDHHHWLTSVVNNLMKCCISTLKCDFCSVRFKTFQFLRFDHCRHRQCCYMLKVRHLIF